MTDQYIEGRAYSVVDVKDVSETDDHYVVRGIASTPSPDRMDDVVEPLGAKFKLPLPLLWQHNQEKPVGRVEEASPKKSGIPVNIQIPKVKEAGVLKDRIDEAIQSIKYRLVTGLSIGFRALRDAVEVLETGGYRFKEWEWLELSLVTIPANAEATITSIKSIDTQLRAKAGKPGCGKCGFAHVDADGIDTWTKQKHVCSDTQLRAASGRKGVSLIPASREEAPAAKSKPIQLIPFPR